jgi:hypothetical protein
LGGYANIQLTQRLEAAGLMSMGNAASVQQAIEARQMLQTQRQVAASISSQDAAGIYQFFRGSAAVAGLPFNANQRLAAQQMAGGIAQYGPAISMGIPGGSEFMDVMSGPAGSIHAMSAQMMDANRYRIDPVTGRYGLGSAANAAMISNVYNNMFSEDNMTRMQGLRAGDVGQIYRALSSEGLAGPNLSLRDRTLNALAQERQAAGNLSGVAADSNIAPEVLTGDLNRLTNRQLEQVRASKTIQSRITKDDARQITDQLQGYVESIAAMREVFGEAGNPNAPIPQIIGALKALTGGQMQKFDPAALTTMVRDLQAMSQMSGKSVDQLLAMSQTANNMNTSILGANAPSFNPAVLQAGVTSGIAFSQAGGATGFGAINRQQAEQTTMSLFSRGLGSETSQAMGALLRVQQSGGFANNSAGQRLSAVMSAAAAGQDYYEFNGSRMSMPTTLNEFRALASQGGIAGGDATTFNMMLTDTTANMRALAENPGMQQVAFNQQRRQINSKLAQSMGFRLESEGVFRTGITDNSQRKAAANRISTAGLSALNALTPAEMQNPDMRISAMAEAIRAESATYGVNLSEAEARTIAASQFGQAETTIQGFGFDSYTGYAQVHGAQVSEARTAAAQAASVRADTNSALSKLQKSGGVLGRFGDAIRNQGEKAARGEQVDLGTLMEATFGTKLNPDRPGLTGPMQSVQNAYNELMNIEGQFAGASPQEQKELKARAAELTKQLEQSISEVGREVDASGLGAAQNMAKLSLGNYSEDAARLGITEEEYLEAIKSGKLPDSLKVISDKDVLSKARAAETTITNADRELAMYQNDLAATNPVVRGRAEAATAAVRTRKNSAMQAKEAGMRALGLTPGNVDDEKKYKVQLENQGAAALLQQRAESWAASRADLKGKVADPEKVLEDTISAEKQARATEAEAEAKVLPTSELNTIADALGLDKSTDRKDLAKNLTGSEGDASVANQKLIAGVLETLNRTGDPDSKVSAIKRLDQLTDRYNAAKGDKKALEALAKEHKMSVSSLEKMMAQTEFLGMAENKGDYSAADFTAAMASSSNTDRGQEAESNSRRINLEGTLVVKGELTGTATLASTTGILGQ